MSFILDALKKSENDRQRQSGPALFEVRVPPPRSKLPMLAIVIVSLLVVNLAVVGWIMLRKPAAAAEAPAPVAAAPIAAAAGSPPVAAQQSAPAAQQNYGQQPGYTQQQNYAQNPQQYSQQQGMQPPPNMPQQAYNGTPTNNGYPPPQNMAQNGYPPQGANQGTNQGASNGEYPQQNTAGGYGRAPNQEPSLDPNAASAQELADPDDYEPARDAPPPGSGAGRVTRGNVNGLPSYDEAASQTQIPHLHLDLHSYAADPTKRFVLINMKRLYEGQSLPEGPKVESITNEATIMSYKGKRFVLEKD
jgi:general secretion pathway protein B